MLGHVISQLYIYMAEKKILKTEIQSFCDMTITQNRLGRKISRNTMYNIFEKVKML